MILPPYRIADSCIPGAGKGLFLQAPVARGRVVVGFSWIESLARSSRALVALQEA